MSSPNRCLSCFLLFFFLCCLFAGCTVSDVQRHATHIAASSEAVAPIAPPQYRGLVYAISGIAYAIGATATAIAQMRRTRKVQRRLDVAKEVIAKNGIPSTQVR